MISKKYINRLLESHKNSIKKYLKKQKINEALQLISICADLLYQTNISYIDYELEGFIEKISYVFIDNKEYDKKVFEDNKNAVIFYDGFGLNSRGLAQIYLKALCEKFKVTYITYKDRELLIPDINGILRDNGCDIKLISRKKKCLCDQIIQLKKIIKEVHPSSFFLYTVPDDVVATTTLYACNNLFCRYQINLTDHAFWLGVNCIDKCIEFRSYGANISYEYRGIGKDKLVLLPFYPIVNEGREFLGFPFEKKANNKIIFSGGALYKTLGGNNLYYQVVDRILQKFPNVIFWYAGSGDARKMYNVIKKYPNRVFLTEERPDLFQVLEHCDVYLSTYPISGGLMFQYSALAGKVPVTLANGEDSEGFLLNQEKLGIEFSDIDGLLIEIGKLLTDKNYCDQRASLMKNSVMKSTIFNNEVQNVANGKQSSFSINYRHIDTNGFLSLYLSRFSKKDLDIILISRNSLKYSVTHYPIRFVKMGLSLVLKRFLRH